MSNNTGYALKDMRRFILTSWSDTIRFYEPVEDFDGVMLMNIGFTTITTGNILIDFVVTSEPLWNIGKAVQPVSNSIYHYLFSMFGDPRAQVTLYTENASTYPIPVTKRPQLNQISYEVLFNGQSGDPDISPSNPMLIELAFFKKIAPTPENK
jgi:hypothetical protein